MTSILAFKFLNGVAFKCAYGLRGSVWTEHLSVGIFDPLKIPPVPSERSLNLLLFFPLYSSDTVILEYNNTTKIVVLNWSILSEMKLTISFRSSSRDCWSEKIRRLPCFWRSKGCVQYVQLSLPWEAVWSPDKTEWIQYTSWGTNHQGCNDGVCEEAKEKKTT